MPFQPGGSGAGRVPVADVDEAATFAESAATVSTTGTTVQNGSVVLKDEEQGSALDVNSTTPSEITTDSGYGIEFKPKVHLAAVSVSSFGVNKGDARVELQRSSDGAVLASKSVTYDNPGGQDIKLNAVLQPDTEYRVLSYPAQGNSSQTIGEAEDRSPENSQINVLWGASDDSSQMNLQARAFGSILGFRAYLSGSVVVSWPHPEDIFAWDLAQLQTAAGNGSVVVDVEQEDGAGGWTTIFSDIDRGQDLSTLAPERNVRFRVYLARPTLSDDPSIDYLARRHKL